MEQNYTLIKGVTMTIEQSHKVVELIIKANDLADQAIAENFTLKEFKARLAAQYDTNFFRLICAQLQRKEAEKEMKEAVLELQIARGY